MPVRNDPRQYDELAGEWWRPGGVFRMLHWIAAARARHVPSATRPGAVLVDVACGGGLLAPHVAGLGYRHVGVDVGRAALRIAREHGILPVQGDARCLPVADGAADVVVAGEVLEHVPDLPAVVAEVARVLRPGGTLVADTLADTRLSRFVTITLGEAVGAAPRGLHDPRLYVDRAALVREAARHGIDLRLVGLRPSVADLALRRPEVRMLPMPWTGVLFAAVGRKRA
jgi:2-polyprenyl-6-hydroxyphenyl methylase/3-demethylubiquinone-9 3-methyltransferase